MIAATSGAMEVSATPISSCAAPIIQMLCVATTATAPIAMPRTASTSPRRLDVMRSMSVPIGVVARRPARPASDMAMPVAAGSNPFCCR